MSDQYYLPSQTARLLTPDRLQRCKNLGLLLDKYPPQTAIDTSSKSDGKSSWLRGFTSDNHIDTQLVENVYKRWQSAIAAMQAQHFTATTAWRMVVGLGGETVLETDLTLHHLYGIPFIPGSALKGLTRAYVTGEVEGYKSKKIEDDNSAIQRIFGSQERAGSVIFFDALPINGKINFDLDIMNAHYPKYYGEKQPPANNQDPNPVTFLTVADTTFLFALAPRHPKDTEDVGLAIGWLQKALKDYGIGGKTSAGYGYFREFISQPPLPEDAYTQPQPAEPIDPELKKAEGYKHEVDVLNNVAGQIHGYYQKWQQLNSKEARLLLAQAIIEKVRQAGREKATAEKAWYKELRAFLEEK